MSPHHEGRFNCSGAAFKGSNAATQQFKVLSPASYERLRVGELARE